MSSLTLTCCFSLASLMDREVTLFGEMDKVKAEASKLFMLKPHESGPAATCCPGVTRHNLIT